MPRLSFTARPGAWSYWFSSQGAPVGTFDLLSAGWPDEAVAPLAGANRVYVAIATLRKLGLERFLVRTKDGYALDPGARVDVVH